MSDLPNRVICTIELPSGAIFDVWSRFVQILPPDNELTAIYREDGSRYAIVRADKDFICRFARPKIADVFLPEIRKAWEAAGLLPPDHVIHWVGDQNTIESVCTCFGLPEGCRVLPHVSASKNAAD